MYISTIYLSLYVIIYFFSFFFRFKLYNNENNGIYERFRVCMRIRVCMYVRMLEREHKKER